MPPPAKASSLALSHEAGANIKSSMATKSTTTASVAPLTSGSNITVFLRNLRLLNLDHSQDWPSITALSFSTRSAQQNQKNRIRCVEWALYHLFEIWNAEESRNKLRPFFPPLEPLQSLNLRAALFRSLSELKKNGNLGREVILRKTMLDECTGDRFEEVLAVFSTVVLRKVVRAENHDHKAVARKLATTDSLSIEEQRSMLPLACAHRASLASLLRRKQLLRTRYEGFAQTLELKSKHIERRNEQLQASSEGEMYQDEIGAAEAETLITQVRENWLGDGRWAEITVRGRSQQGKDPVLDSTFTNIFAHVRSGNLGYIEDQKEKGLLEDLDTRINEQRERLKRWAQFRETLKVTDHTSAPCESTKDAGQSSIKRIDLGFGDHQRLLPGRVSPTRKAPSEGLGTPKGDIPQSWVNTEYDRFTAKLQEELVNIARPKARGGKGWHESRSDNGSTGSDEGSASGIKKPCRNASRNQRDSASQTGTLDKGAIYDVRIPLGQDEQQSTGCIKTNGLSNVERPSDDDELMQTSSEAPGDRSLMTSAMAQELTTSPNTMYPSNMLLLEVPGKQSQSLRLPAVETQDQELLAEAIISSVTEAAPSPVKPRQSLVERTRMSMVLSSSQNIHQTMMMGPPLPPAPPAEDPVKFGSRTGRTDFDSKSTLLERTRQSMSILPAISQRTRKSIHKTQSSKGYPTNQFETPKKQQLQESTADGKDSTPRDELFSQEADYASVFKSRPKIALSPSISPSIGVEGLSGLGEGTDHASNDSPWGSSPLMRVR
ncbi:MAG: hypothetical protein M1830_008411 [Pleopsidium flavum]|nr:MAG: hypothetical protein M1830_008411 [Pleopsidium flavum]